MAKILIVDDDSFDRSLIAKSLRKAHADVQVCEVGDPKEVYPKINEFEPDIMLIDISMGAISGFDVLQKISQKGATRPKSVFMLSGSTSRADKETSERLGADGYLVKPSSLSGYDKLAQQIV